MKSALRRNKSRTIVKLREAIAWLIASSGIARVLYSTLGTLTEWRFSDLLEDGCSALAEIGRHSSEGCKYCTVNTVDDTETVIP